MSKGSVARDYNNQKRERAQRPEPMSQGPGSLGKSTAPRRGYLWGRAQGPVARDLCGRAKHKAPRAHVPGTNIFGKSTVHRRRYLWEERRAMARDLWGRAKHKAPRAYVPGPTGPEPMSQGRGQGSLGKNPCPRAQWPEITAPGKEEEHIAQRL